jgi:hypothetical protein
VEHTQVRRLLLVCFWFMAAVSHGQGPGGMGEFPECDPDPPRGCEFLTYIERHYNALVRYEEPVIQTTVETMGSWEPFDACVCAWVACDARPACNGGNLGRELERSTCWEFTGGIDAEFGSGLLVRLLAAAQISVGVDVRRQNCERVRERFDCPVPREACFRVFGRIDRIRVTGHDRETRARVRDVYWCFDEWQYGPRLMDCGEFEVRASFQANTGHWCRLSQRPVNCGGAPDPAPPEPPFKRHEACCPTVSGCQPGPGPGQRPCCGCFAGS